MQCAIGAWSGSSARFRVGLATCWGRAATACSRVMATACEFDYRLFCLAVLAPGRRASLRRWFWASWSDGGRWPDLALTPISVGCRALGQARMHAYGSLLFVAVNLAVFDLPASLFECEWVMCGPLTDCFFLLFSLTLEVAVEKHIHCSGRGSCPTFG